MMRLRFAVLLAFSLAVFNVRTVEPQGFFEGEIGQGDANVYVPVYGGPTEAIEGEKEESSKSSHPFVFRQVYNKGLPIFAPLKSILSWKEDQTFLGSILQIKVAIEVMHEKHESLLNHIKCVFPTPPENCTSIHSHSSKWNWTSLIPTGFKPQSFFHPTSEQEIGPIASVFISAIEHLENKQNKIYEFLSCACQKSDSNCTKPSWHLFNGTYWHNKIHNLNPLNWHLFNISKPLKPSSGYFSGYLIHKPILAFFNHSSGAGEGHTGFVVALTGGHVPNFPSGVYGSSSGQSSAHEGAGGESSASAHEGTGGESSGGFGGYASASLPSYTGTVIVGNFPHTGEFSGAGSGHIPVFVAGGTEGHVHEWHQSDHAASTAQDVPGTVHQTSSGSSSSESDISISATSAEKPVANSVTVPKCPGSKSCTIDQTGNIKPNASVITEQPISTDIPPVNTLKF